MVRSSIGTELRGKQLICLLNRITVHVASYPVHLTMFLYELWFIVKSRQGFTAISDKFKLIAKHCDTNAYFDKKNIVTLMHNQIRQCLR